MIIKQVQLLLTYLGYDPGEIDGANGPKTTAAVLIFQSREGLEQDGRPGPLTQERLLDAVANGRFYSEADISADDSSTGDGTFWNEIEYFKRGEFACHCNGKYCNGFPVEMSEETVRIVDEIRRRAGVPINIGSGVRCTKHNAAVGGVSNSRHLTGLAADLNCSLSPSVLHTIAEEVMKEKIPGRGGLGLYSWGIHVDTGAYSRWNG